MAYLEKTVPGASSNYFWTYKHTSSKYRSQTHLLTKSLGKRTDGEFGAGIKPHVGIDNTVSGHAAHEDDLAIINLVLEVQMILILEMRYLFIVDVLKNDFHIECLPIMSCILNFALKFNIYL